MATFGAGHTSSCGRPEDYAETARGELEKQHFIRTVLGVDTAEAVPESDDVS